MKKILGILAVIGSLALAGPVFAVTVSSTTSNVAILPPILIQANETVGYSVSGTSTGTITLQISRNGQDYTETGISFVGTGSIGSNSGIIYAGDTSAYFRWNVSTITAGSFVTSLTDRDDPVGEFKSNKKVSVFQIYDETIRYKVPPVYSPSPTLSLNSTDQLDKDSLVYGFNVFTSSGGPLTLSATPTITTTTWAEGTRFIIQSATNTITFQDNGTLSGSLLELGANTRALGVGDILELIFRNSTWWEIGFYNN